MNTHKKQKNTNKKYLKDILVCDLKNNNKKTPKTEPLLGKKSNDEVGQKGSCPSVKG